MIQQHLTQRLIEGALITEEQHKQVLAAMEREEGRYFPTLLKLNLCTEEKLMQFLSQYFRLPFVDLKKIKVDPQVIKQIPMEVVKKYRTVPVKRVGNRLTVAMEDPTDVFAIDDIKFMTGYEIEPVLASPLAIGEAMDTYYDSANQFEEVMKGIDENDDVETVDEMNMEDDGGNTAEDAPVVKLVNLILAEAIKRGASDIHIEAYEKKFRVRYRVDGTLYEIMNPPMRMRPALTSRLKIMSNLDISERRIPQDGRIKLKLKDREVDLRVSTLPCLFGEKIVMRILDKGNLTLDISKLGFPEKGYQDFLRAITSPFGMVLVTGPTGSGKTTTLYSALHHVNDTETNIMTAEDPVEYNLFGVNQVHVKEDVGLSFPAALRSFLRQDPDIIMVGEIRDGETAEIAIKAALTGHLVLSTLHTNDAPATIARLLNMGVEPFMVGSSVIMVLAQRLARRICKECKEPMALDKAALVKVGLTPQAAEKVTVYHGKGCPNCNNTGYKGRVALYEIMLIDDAIREQIYKGANTDQLKKVAIARGMETLRMNGIRRMIEGITTLDEVYATTMGD
ncbi:MAG: type IV-A pilus assembly ATPase PilB [Nitrospirota bacterium]|nr:type IV-A pilus assembly ATPase PilB [Nitrospirota bacterium]